MSTSSTPDDAQLAPGRAHYQYTLLGQFDERILSTVAARWVLAVLLGIALIVPSVQSVIKIQETKAAFAREGGERQRTALGRWLPTARLLADPNNKEDPYGYGHWMPTSPMVLLSLVPLSMLGYAGAGAVWATLKVGGFLVAMTFLIRSLGRNTFAVPVGVLLAAGLFSIRPIVSDLQHGNLNIFVVIWLAFAWGLYIRKRDFWAGIFVALAIVTKLTPALALVYFVYQRAWRVCTGILVGCLLLFIVIPGLLIGFEQNQIYLESWFDTLVAPFTLHGYGVLHITNQSLYGVGLRLLSNAGILAVESMPTEDIMNTGMDNMARPATDSGRLMRPILVLPVALALAWFCRWRPATLFRRRQLMECVTALLVLALASAFMWHAHLGRVATIFLVAVSALAMVSLVSLRFARSIPSRNDPRLLLEFGLVLIAMLLLSERTWKHHATTLPIIFLGVWYTLTCVRFSDKFRAWFVAGLIAQLLLLVGSTEALVTDRIADLLLDGGVFCWGLVLCFVQIGILLATLNRRQQANDAMME
ncbi:MAG: DUF2029 domain-containing protein [Phycisphaerales bacterium]|nr:DUF2029 domain-containing protein [Phycisphaerales bacterium]